MLRVTNKIMTPEALEYASNSEYPDYSSRNSAEFIENAFYWFANPDHENSVKHMYLDTKGIVTIGIGHAILQAEAVKKLEFVFRKPPTPGQEPGEGDKAAAYNKIKAMWATLKSKKPFPLGNSATFRKESNLDMKEDTIKELFEEDIKFSLKKLEATFPQYNKYPDEAKLGLLEMAYNLGYAGLIGKFPKLVRAAKMGDWSTVAKECHRNGIGQKRNDDTKELFEKAARKSQLIDETPLVIPLLQRDDIQNDDREFPDLWA